MYISEDILTRLKIRLESGTPVTIDDPLPLDLADFLKAHTAFVGQIYGIIQGIESQVNGFDQRLDGTEGTVSGFDNRIDNLESGTSGYGNRIEDLENAASSYGSRITGVEAQAGQLEGRVLNLEYANQLKEKTIVVLGDSISDSMYNQGRSWVDCIREHLMAAPVPWRIINLSATGLTFANAQTSHQEYGNVSPISTVVDLQPDVVIIALGTGDALLNKGGYSSSQINTQANNLINTLKSGISGVKIIYAKPVLWDIDHNPTVSGSWKNKYFLPFHWTIPSSGSFSGKRTMEWKETNISGTNQGHYNKLKAVIDYVSTKVDAVVKHDIWKAHRLGCSSPDMIHVTPAGQKFMASSMSEQFRNTWNVRNVLGWGPDNMTFGDADFQSFNYMFSQQVFNSVSSEWRLQTPINYLGIASISDGDEWEIQPESWHCVYKMVLHTNNSDGGTAPFGKNMVLTITGAQPQSTVALYSPSWFGNSNWQTYGKTDRRGVYSVVISTAAYSPGTYNMWCSVGSDVPEPLAIRV